MRRARSCPRKSSSRLAMVHHDQLFALLFAELRFSYAFGARSCAFHQVRSRLTGAWPKQLANRKPLVRSGAQSAPTRLRLSFRATASFAKRAYSAIIIGIRFANGPSLDGNSHRKTRLAAKKPIESGPRRLNNQPKIDIVAAANIVSDRRLRMEKISLDYAGFRHEYIGGGLRRADLDPDPIKQFQNWFAAAIKAGIPDANAMTLATSLDSRPSARVVLLKDFDERGFVFFTNYSSDKGRQLEKNPNAALLMYWMEVERQIRIEGKVEKTSREESEDYFRTRPFGAQLGAWASHQSAVIDGRRVLDARLEEMKQRFAEGQIPLPPHWGGFRLNPDRMEFWQGRPDRLHDRFRYTLQSSGSWSIDRLAPCFSPRSCF